MKKLALILVFVYISLFLFSEDQIEFINNLSNKNTADFHDLIKSFLYLNEIKVSEKFEDNIKSINQVIKYLPKKYSADKALTYGDFSLFAMQQLKMNTGLMYLATKSGRYAIRELMIINLIPFNTSEWENMSGLDLIKYIEKVAEYETKSKS